MRNLPSYISERLTRNIQTRANKSDPSASLWVGRPNTVMTSDEFLERQTALFSTAEDVSIAVCHPRARRENTKIYIAYINDGELRVASALHKLKMEDHVWFDEGFSKSATAVSIAFDGTMPKNTSGKIDFVTEEIPWIFWVDNGALYGSKLNGEPIMLAESNCTDVSAVRAMWSESGGYDFGLVVFFLLDGVIHYRQLIDGEWMDAEIVTFGPSGVTWIEISAFRTWDYRVGIQCKSSDGTIYELFTQFMGIAKQNAEHVEVKSIDVSDKFTTVNYRNRKVTDEHVEIASVTIDLPNGGLISAAMPTIIAARNVEDANGDWGTTVEVTFGNRLDVTTIPDNYLQFTIEDSWGVAYYPTAAVAGDDAQTIILSFMNLNQAYGQCVLSYTPGTLESLIDTVVEATSIGFTPENLSPVDIPRPEVESIWNE